MASANATDPVNVVLSRDELLLILSLLRAQYIPGLDVEPLGERTPEQEDLAFVVAARGLRARDLARVRVEEGRLTVHAGLLAAVSACAYSDNAAFVYRWPSRAEAPQRLFGHVRDGFYVIHAPVEDVLHRFTMLASKEHLVDHILAACRLPDALASTPGELQVPGGVFAQVRQLAEQGDVAQAGALLATDSSTADLAGALLATLAGQPEITIFQTLRQVDVGSVVKRDFTLVQDANALWLVAATAADADTLLVKATAQDEVRSLLFESI
jgi:hypothetical protein